MNSESPHKSKPGLTRVWKALGYSLQGLRTAFQCESAFRQELLLATLLLPLALVLPISAAFTALVVSSTLLVLIVELLNSAIEAAVDRISLDDHELARRAKDISSAAVLLTLLNCAVVWLLALGETYG